MAEGEGFEPPVRFPVQWFSSSQADSEPFGKFSTLFAFSMGYKASVLIGSDYECSVLSMELLQFYYSRHMAPLLCTRTAQDPLKRRPEPAIENL